jgi:hypothetical protein
MTRGLKHLGRAVALLVLMAAPVAAAAAPTPSARMTAAANAFLATLDAKQRQSVLYPFDDVKQRQRWSNLPKGLFDRGGLSLKEMTATQRAAAMTLVASALSAKGYQKVRNIMLGDDQKKLAQDNGDTEAGPGGQPLIFGSDFYFISIMGTPSATAPWMLQFGGHHLGLNVTVAGARGVLTPTFTGTQPAVFTAGGKTVRALGAESDKALALLNSLDAKQRSQAILSYNVADLVLGPGEDGKTVMPEGLKASAMNERQRALLLDVVSEWSGIIQDDLAASRMAEIKADLDNSWFAWSGPVTPGTGGNITAYFRIQGPHLMIEYAPQSRGGDRALHVHTIYRDPTNDYGRSFTGR